MADRSFGDFLTTALELLRAESAAHFARIVRRFRGRTVAITVVPHATVRVQFDRQPWVQAFTNAPVQVEVSIHRAELAALLEGTRTIEQSVLAGELQLRGSIEHVIPFLNALTDFVHGAVRCVSFPTLYGAYLRSSAPEPNERQSC